MKLKAIFLGLVISNLFMTSMTELCAQQAVEAWVQRFSNATEASDLAGKVVADSAGNVIVIGYSNERVTADDMVIVKYSAAGDAIWTNRYNGPANGEDRATAVAVNESGDIFVAGYSTNSQTGLDYVTVAYSSAGTVLWTNRYNGPGNGEDRATDVAVGKNGSVFVTGYSKGNLSGLDYATVAYSGAGLGLWTNRYRGPLTGVNRANSIAVAGSGNVIVTGTSTSSGGLDYTTIAYSGVGVGLWTNRYNGPGNRDDEALAVAVDTNNNAFVTGYSFSGTTATSSDYVTIAYSGAGVSLWTNRYSGIGEDRAIAVVVGGSSTVFVTGTSLGSGNDYVTIAYANTGEGLWTNRYNSSEDQAKDVAIDTSGNVFVTGYSTSGGGSDYVTIAYSSGGIALWTNRFSGPGNNLDQAAAVAVDAGGGVLVTGYSVGLGSAEDFVTIKYSGAGIGFWTNRYAGSGNSDDEPLAVAVGNNGRLFVTGLSYGVGTGGDFATVAYSSTGVALWTNRYSSLGDNYDIASAVVISAGENVIVSGNSYSGVPSLSDCITIAYSSAGVALWTNRYSNTGSSDDGVIAVASDASGNVFVTGSSVGSGTQYDYVTIAYSNTGVALWTNRYNGLGNLDDVPTAIAVGANGDVFVTGYSVGNGTSFDYATIRYSNAGTAIWTNRYNGLGNAGDVANAVATDGNGNIYVTGHSAAGSTADFATIAYSSAGDELWVKHYNGNYADVAEAVSVDASNNVYVTGYSAATSVSPYNFNFLTIAYSSSGLALWTNGYNGPGNNTDWPKALVVGANGTVFVTGSSWGSGTVQDFATIAYSSAGVPLSTNRYSGPAKGSDAPNSKQSIVIVSDGVVVVGASDGDFTGEAGYDYAVVKYAFSAASNQPPTSYGFGAVTTQDQPLLIAVSNLLSVVFDPEGSAVALVSVAATSTNGGTVTHINNIVSYTPPGAFVGADAFSYVVSDFLGATNGVIAQIAVLPIGAVFQGFSSPLITPGGVSFNFAASPRETWSIYRATEVTGPWTNLGAILIPATGMSVFQDLNPPPISAFYRASKL